MRTKSIILGAALLAAGVASSMAQVTNVLSVNVVGYVNLNLTNGLNLIANPLDAAGGGNATGNTLANVFTALPDGTQVYKFTNGPTPGTSGFLQQDLFFNGPGWLGGGVITFNPGEGLFISIPSVGGGGPVGGTNVTFVGSVVQSNTTLQVKNGLNIFGYQAPVMGGITTVQNFQPNIGDQLFYWDATAQNYTASYLYEGIWLPNEPTNTVGQAIFIISAGTNNWTNTFKVQ